MVLSGKRASTFHTATVLIDALDGEDTYVVYFLPFSIDNGLGKLSARYLPPPRGAQRHGAAGCAGRVASSSIRAMATTASRSTPRCDGRRAPAAAAPPASSRCRSRRTRRSASSTIASRVGAAARAAAAAGAPGARGETIVFQVRVAAAPLVLVGYAAVDAPALRPQLRCLSLEGTDHFGAAVAAAAACRWTRAARRRSGLR